MMFIGERIDGKVAKAIYVDGHTLAATARSLKVDIKTVRRARQRIIHNLKILKYDPAHKSPDEVREMVQHLLENAPQTAA